MIDTKHQALITNHFKVKRSFTLIELLIVITIMAILIATGTYSWQAAQIKARDNRRKVDLKAIQQALESFYQTNGRYPPATYDARIYTGGWYTQISTTSAQWSLDVRQALEAGYISKVPQDPTYANSSSDYFYWNPTISTYRLYSRMENTKDQDYNNNPSKQQWSAYDSFSGCAGMDGNSVYNYKVTNP